MTPRESATALLDEHHETLRAFLRRRAGWLLRHESVDDLVQGVSTRVLEHDRFEARSREEDLAWLHRVARSHIADRIAHWTAAKRRRSGLLRITFGIADERYGDAVPEPACERTGPETAARRGELLDLVERALPLLLDRDRTLVEWDALDIPLLDQAQRLGISYAATKAAKHRAFARLRDAVELVRTRGTRRPRTSATPAV